MDWMLKGAADKLEDLLSTNDVPRDIKEYPTVGHSFMNNWDTPPRPVKVIERVVKMNYSRPEAEDAWQRVFAFFGEHLRDSGPAGS